MTAPWPACMEWPVPPALDCPSMQAMFDWQAGRCGLCGCRPVARGVVSNLVLDHDHESKRVRGYICRSCNTREGNTRRHVPQLARWRGGWNPATLMGVDEMYAFLHQWGEKALARDS